jgi:hypothetical protein
MAAGCSILCHVKDKNVAIFTLPTEKEKTRQRHEKDERKGTMGKICYTFDFQQAFTLAST